MNYYKVVEKFVSVNGEGQLAGELAVFIRFAGCNLSCSYCDTMWANDKSVKHIKMTAEQIYEYIVETGIKNVTLTGGEPLLQEDIVQLLDFLAKDTSLNIEIETNGSVNIRNFLCIESKKPSFTLDYKLPSSGMESKMLTENYPYLDKKDTVKFVVGDMEDLKRAKEIIDKYNLTQYCKVHLSSIFGKITLNNIVEFMKQNRMNMVKLQPQLHKIIWEPEKRGV
jgi:7-carboxy-7-deazaguanine synthase